MDSFLTFVWLLFFSLASATNLKDFLIFIVFSSSVDKICTDYSWSTLDGL